MSTTFKAVKDRAYSTVASGLDNVTDPVTFDVGAGHGARFPDVSADGEFKISVENEILRCTARATDALTVVRAQDGTAAAAHANGVAVELRLIASLLDDITAALTAVEDGKFVISEMQTITGPADVILANARVIRIDGDADYVLTGAPLIAAGVNGQLVTIVNDDATNVFTFQDESLLVGSTMRLKGVQVELHPRESITFVYDPFATEWLQISDPPTAPSLVQSFTGVAGIVEPCARTVQIDSDGDYTLTSTPHIRDGIDGQLLTILNVDAGNTITFRDETGEAGCNLRLAGAANVALSPMDVLHLIYNATIGDWVQTGVSTN